MTEENGCRILDAALSTALSDAQKTAVSSVLSAAVDATQSTVADADEAKYLDRARELADSYSFLLQRKAELEEEIEASKSWFFTREDVLYKLSMGAHEESERVQTSGVSNPVERTAIGIDKVLEAMNREIREEQQTQLIDPYRSVCEQIELFEIALRSLKGQTRLVAEQLYVQGKKQCEVVDAAGKTMGRKRVEAEKQRGLSGMAKTLERIGG